MQVSGNYFSLIAGAGLRIEPTRQVSSVAPTVNSGPSLRDFAKLVLNFRDAHKGLVLDGRRTKKPGGLERAQALSASALEIATTTTATTLRSIEEVNTTPTSFTPSSPTFAGSSSSSPFIGGTYSGANGDTTLTFTATLGGVVGSTPVQFEVRDSQSNLIDTINLGFNPPGTEFTLSNGLKASFSAGTVFGGDSFQMDVFATVGSAVRLDKAFDGLGDQGAGFEPGYSVSAGSFDVNGVSIAVGVSDTLNDILNRINASAAGVSATFDSDSERVVLTQDTLGSSADILIENDTSGLIAALKLDTASSELGSNDESGSVISDVSALSGIQSGDFTINGITLTVDVLQDSLDDLIDRINSSVPGVLAIFDAESGTVRIRSTGSSPLSIENGTSQLFAGLDIAEGTFQGKKTQSKTKFRDESAFRKGLGDLLRAYSEVLDGSFKGFGSGTISNIRGQFDSAISKTFEDVLGKSGDGSLRSGLGIDFNTGPGEHRRLELDPARLSKALERDPDALVEFLFGTTKSNGKNGLFAALEERLAGVMNTMNGLLGDEGLGLSLDVSG